MSEMHMNGHENGNGQSYEASFAGFHLMPPREPPNKKMNRQQTVILQHLQTKGAITPLIAKNQYDCKDVAAIISQLRAFGWDIQTDRLRDKNGSPFSSYRLPGVQAEDVQPEEHASSTANTETRNHDAEERPPPASGNKVRFIIPLSASETSVTLARADFDFMMQIVAKNA